MRCIGVLGLFYWRPGNREKEGRTPQVLNESCNGFLIPIFIRNLDAVHLRNIVCILLNVLAVGETRSLCFEIC